MPNWIHLSLEFKDYNETMKQLYNDALPQKKPTGLYKELIHYLKNVIDQLPDLINRYFYLFEPNPHLFLALEVKNMKDIDSVKHKINQIEKPDFVRSANIDLNTNDQNNGEAAIDFFCAGTKYAFSRITDDYKPGYYNNDETKLVHCLCNQLFVAYDNEIKFYLEGLKLRGFKMPMHNT